MANETLAPHPITFSVDGRPAETDMMIDGIKYRMIWDGKSLILKEDSPLRNYFRIDPAHLGPIKKDLAWVGCLIVIISVIIFYGTLGLGIIKVWKWFRNG